MTTGAAGRRVPIHLLSIAVCVLFLGPLLWGVASSLRPLDEIFRYTMPFSPKALVPTTPTLEAYRVIFFEKGFGRALLNTALVAVATVVGRLPLDTADRPWGRDDEFSLRWILLHLVEEYARHNGHADLLREAIDGATGE